MLTTKKFYLLSILHAYNRTSTINKIMNITNINKFWMDINLIQRWRLKQIRLETSQSRMIRPTKYHQKPTLETNRITLNSIGKKIIFHQYQSNSVSSLQELIHRLMKNWHHQVFLNQRKTPLAWLYKTVMWLRQLKDTPTRESSATVLDLQDWLTSTTKSPRAKSQKTSQTQTIRAFYSVNLISIQRRLLHFKTQALTCSKSKKNLKLSQSKWHPMGTTFQTDLRSQTNQTSQSAQTGSLKMTLTKNKFLNLRVCSWSRTAKNLDFSEEAEALTNPANLVIREVHRLAKNPMTTFHKSTWKKFSRKHMKSLMRGQ